MRELLNKVICGDCLEVLPRLPDKFVDAIVTDPPYGMGKDFGNKSDEEENALMLIQKVMPELFRVLKPGRMAFIFGSPRLIHKTVYIAEFSGFTFHRFLWLYKPNDCTYPWRGWLLKSEAIAVFSRGKPLKWEEKLYCHDTYIFNHRKGELPKDMFHPSVKPLEVIQDIVSKCPEGIVLDPFLGSGTTAVAALKTGRYFIGIEKEPKYVEIANKRIQEITQRLNIEETIKQV